VEQLEKLYPQVKVELLDKLERLEKLDLQE